MISPQERKQLLLFLKKDEETPKIQPKQDIKVVNSFVQEFKDKKLEKKEPKKKSLFKFPIREEDKNLSLLEEINEKIHDYIMKHKEWYGKKDVVIFDKIYNGFKYKLIISDEIL